MRLNDDGDGQGVSDSSPAGIGRSDAGVRWVQASQADRDPIAVDPGSPNP